MVDDLKRLGDKYLLLDNLGMGGMAQIYRGKLIGDKGFEKLIVIKQLLSHLANDKEMVKHFIDEARLAALLQHENIACIYDFGNIDGSYFIAMEYLFGKDLHSVMQKLKERQQPIPPELALYVISKICEAMHYAHTMKDLNNNPLNIIHRDLTPHNIFLTYDGKVKVLDFGIAKNELQENRTQVGLVKGKISYMSPEQLSETTIDSRSDIFSIGILLYEMLSGQKLYSGNTSVRIQKAMNAEFTPLEKITPGLSPDLYAIVAKATDKNPSTRYQSCQEMQADIEDYIYASSHRVSTNTLETYIRELFAEEYQLESKKTSEVLENASQFGALSKEKFPSSGTGQATTDEKTTIFSSTPPENVRRIMQKPYAIPATAVILCLIIVISWISFSGDSPDEELVPLYSSSAEQSGDEQSQKISEKQLIKSLLLSGSAAMGEGRLVGGQTSAYKYYDDILVIDDNNRKAKKGLAKIEERLHLTILQYIEEAQFSLARKTLDEMNLYYPRHSKMKNLQQAYQEGLEKEIERLFGKAQIAMEKGNIKAPEDDNALQYLNEIKTLNEDTLIPRDYSLKIADSFAILAENAHRSMNIPAARNYVAEGLSFAPNHPHLLQLEKELSDAAPISAARGLMKSVEEGAEQLEGAFNKIFK